MKSKRTKACDIPPAVRRIVNQRDHDCIFCRMMYHLPMGYHPEMYRMEIMHYIPRSAGGLGIPENLAEGCFYHHRMLDQSSQRKEMLLIFESYLRRCYPEWDMQQLYYIREEHRYNDSYQHPRALCRHE